MKNTVLAVLLVCLPAAAQITELQSAATWNCSGSPCQILSFNTGKDHLLVVWTFWESTGTFAASATDSFNNAFVSAVGPTYQATVGRHIASQIFYVKQTNNPGSDNLTVNFNFLGAGLAPSVAGGMVVVEYSGADPNNPLDTASASYSNAQSAVLDSGTLILDSSNLLTFAAGIADQPVAITPGNGYASLQSSTGGFGTGIVENTLAVGTDNALQRATACIGANLPCPQAGGTPANWLMEVAVFRASSSSTVAGGWNPVRPYQVADATQFPGSDPCAQTKTAIEIPINDNVSPVVDSRGFISNGIPCGAAPMAPSDSGTWFPSPGNWRFSAPLILGGQMDIWGASLGYSSNVGTVFEATSQTLQGTWPTSTGGLGGVAPTYTMGGSTCSSTITIYDSHCYYFRGTEATEDGNTWYALQNGFSSIQPSPLSANPAWPFYWTNAANFPNPVVEENITGNGNDVESNSIHNLGLSAQYQSGPPATITDGVVLYLNTNGQEQTIADRIKYRNPTVAGIWLDSGLTADSGPYLGGTIGYDDDSVNANQAACKVALGPTGIGSGTAYSTQEAQISNISVSSTSTSIFPYIATVTLSGTVPQMWVGEVVDIVNAPPTTPSFSPYAAGVTDESTVNTHGFWMVWSIPDTTSPSPTHFTILLPSAYPGCSAPTSCGTANFFPLGINVTANGTPASAGGTAVTPDRGFYNFTINGSNCSTYNNYSNFPPLGAQWSTGSMPFHDTHIEGHRVGLCVGCFGKDTQTHFANLNIATNVDTSILISNQYSSSASAPGVTQVDFRDIQCGVYGGIPVTYCIVDLINGNTLTSLGQSGYIHHYWLDSSGLAYFEGGNCSEMTKGWCRGNTGSSTDAVWSYYSNHSPVFSIDGTVGTVSGQNFVATGVASGSGYAGTSDWVAGNVLPLCTTGSGGVLTQPQPCIETNSFFMQANSAITSSFGWASPSVPNSTNNVLIVNTPSGILSPLNYGTLLDASSPTPVIATANASSFSTGHVVSVISGGGGFDLADAGISASNVTVSAAALANNALVVGSGGAQGLATGNADFTYVTDTLTGGSLGLVDFSGMTSANAFKIPSQPALTSNGTSSIGYDTTNKNTHIPVNGADALAAGEASAIVLNVIPKATNSTQALLTPSLLTDSGTTATYTGTGGLSATGFSPSQTTHVLISGTTPTISSGFGTSPSITTNNGTAAFTIDVGSGGTASSGVIGLPAAANGWNCFAFDAVHPTSGGGFYTKQTGGTTTTATLTGFGTSGTSTAWSAGDILSVSCFAR